MLDRCVITSRKIVTEEIVITLGKDEAQALYAGMNTLIDSATVPAYRKTFYGNILNELTQILHKPLG